MKAFYRSKISLMTLSKFRGPFLYAQSEAENAKGPRTQVLLKN
jgi:hypothetical protein